MKKILWNIVSALLLVAIFYFLGREFWHNWNQIRSYEFHFNLPVLGMASLVYAIAFGVLSFGWYLILRYLNHGFSFGDALLFFCMTQPAKYIPGKIWLPVARIKCCKSRGVPGSITLLSTGIEGVMEIFAGAYVSVIALLQTDFFGRSSVIGTILISVIGLGVLIPPVFYFFINLYLSIVKLPHIEKHQRVSFWKLLLLQIIFITGVLGLGISQFLFLQSFAPVALSQAPFLISVGIFSYIASVLAFFAPGGLGVREGIWYVALKSVGTASVALIYAFSSRLWTIVVEALLLFISLPLFLLKQRRARATNAPHRPS